MMKKFLVLSTMAVILLACEQPQTVNNENKPDVFNPDTEIQGLKFTFSRIEKGSFKMGSNEATEIGRDIDEILHEVNITKPFYMGKYEITQAQWKAVMGTDKTNSWFTGDSLPIENVSWNDVQEFITKLNALTGNNYRLPTEAEWEYACRAGGDTPFNTGDNLTTEQANYNGEFPYGNNPSGINRASTIKVGSFAPNAWGLYDMHGNVWEWCSDWYGPYEAATLTDPVGPIEGPGKVIRGGSYLNHAAHCRSANRDYTKAENKYRIVGFRLAHSDK